MQDKISKIDKIEGSKKAQKLVNKASSGKVVGNRVSESAAKIQVAKKDAKKLAKSAKAATKALGADVKAKFDELKAKNAPKFEKTKKAFKNKAKKEAKALKDKAKKGIKADAAEAKKAIKKGLDKAKKSVNFTIGAINVSSAKKVAKIEAYFSKFLKDAKDKSAFIEKAILSHIKKAKKKAK